MPLVLSASSSKKLTAGHDDMDAPYDGACRDGDIGRARSHDGRNGRGHVEPVSVADLGIVGGLQNDDRLTGRAEGLACDARRRRAVRRRCKVRRVELRVAVGLKPLREVDLVVDGVAEPELETGERRNVGTLLRIYVRLAGRNDHRPAIRLYLCRIDEHGLLPELDGPEANQRCREPHDGEHNSRSDFVDRAFPHGMNPTQEVEIALRLHALLGSCRQNTDCAQFFANDIAKGRLEIVNRH
nr:hypothetical protein CFP56_74473 [Quercus suber]